MLLFNQTIQGVTVYIKLNIKSFEGENFRDSLLKLNIYVGKTFAVENLRPGGTMLCVVSGRRRYSRKIFNDKTFVVSKNPWKLQKFSPSNDLTYMVCVYVWSLVEKLSKIVGNSASSTLQSQPTEQGFW